MRKFIATVAACAALAFPAASQAQLPVGTKAPIFATKGAKGGKVMAFNLKAALRKGPVVLYFYPKAFTQGCTLETREFAEAHDKFAAAGATVVGMSADDLPTLQRFSTEECRDKFAVAVASPNVIKAYDVAFTHPSMKGTLANRTSYVIATDGRIAFVHSDLNYKEHVALTLAAVRKLAKPD
ncbi:MAG: peroxiredoxin [Novosphingobium sp.]|nr:peroxiredoxin [Novosphingobium sp.]